LPENVLKASGQFVKKLLKGREITSILFLLFLFLGVGAVNANFLTPQNIMLSLNSGVVYTIIAIGIAFVIITGEIDVSVGATMGISAAVFATLIRDGSNWGLAAIVSLGIGLVVGLINGVGVTVFEPGHDYLLLLIRPDLYGCHALCADQDKARPVSGRRRG